MAEEGNANIIARVVFRASFIPLFLNVVFGPFLMSPFWIARIDLCGGCAIIARAIRDGLFENSQIGASFWALSGSPFGTSLGVRFLGLFVDPVWEPTPGASMGDSLA